MDNLSTSNLLAALDETVKPKEEPTVQKTKPSNEAPSTLTEPVGIAKIVQEELKKQTTKSRKQTSFEYALKEHYSQMEKGSFETGYEVGSRKSNKRKGKAKQKGSDYAEKQQFKMKKGRKSRSQRAKMY